MESRKVGLASLRGLASRGADCLGGRGPAERAEGIGQMREVGTGQRSPQQAVELAKELSTDASPSFVNGLLARLLALKPGLSLEPTES